MLLSKKILKSASLCARECVSVFVAYFPNVFDLFQQRKKISYLSLPLQSKALCV